MPLGKALSKAAAEKLEEAKGFVTGAAPPPPRAYGLTLKRTPPETPEDEPPQSQCLKITMKCCLIPVAVFTWIIGKLLIMLIMVVGGCLYPCVGNAMLAMIFSDPQAAAQSGKENAQAAGSCLLCIYSVLVFSRKQLVNPLGNLCAW